MSRRLLHALIRLYPPGFRRRYGRELHDLVDELSTREPRRSAGSALGLLAGAAGEWWRRSRPQAVAALLVPALGLAIGVGLVVQPGGATPSRRIATPGERAPRIVTPHAQAVHVQGRACFIASCGGDWHPPVVGTVVIPGPRRGKIPTPKPPRATPRQRRVIPHAVFISAV